MLDPLQFAYSPRIRVDDAVTITNLESTGGLKVVCFFTFPVPFYNRASTSLEQTKGVAIEQHLAAWTIDFLTNRPQYVRLRDYISDVVLSSVWAPLSFPLHPLHIIPLHSGEHAGFGHSNGGKILD